MQGHDFKVMIYQDTIEMEVGRLHCGGRKRYCWDSRWAMGASNCPLAVNLAPKFCCTRIFGYTVIMRGYNRLSADWSPKLGEYSNIISARTVLEKTKGLDMS